MLRQLLLFAAIIASPAFAREPASVSSLREDFLTWRFGMFIHFNVATFNERQWATGCEDPATFAPTKLDCNQWLDAAAGMKYAVLTVKHTGGWCLWDSKQTASHDMTAFGLRQHRRRMVLDHTGERNKPQEGGRGRKDAEVVQ